MTFSETEKFFKSNIDNFDALIPSMDRPGQVILDMIDVFHCLEENPEYKPNLSRENLDKAQSICRLLIDDILVTGVTEFETQLIGCVVDVMYNYSEVDEVLKIKDLNTLILLTQSKRTMDKTIKLLSALYDKFRMFEACNLEEETATLSRKYYAELKAFMERKGDHDAPYNTDRSKTEPELRISQE